MSGNVLTILQYHGHFLIHVFSATCTRFILNTMTTHLDVQVGMLMEGEKLSVYSKIPKACFASDVVDFQFAVMAQSQ